MQSSLEVRRRRRKDKGLTLSDLGDRLKLSTGQVSRIEHEGTASVHVAMKLADILELPIEAFVKPEQRP